MSAAVLTAADPLLRSEPRGSVARVTLNRAAIARFTQRTA
jgi:hypothetical protein